MSKYLIVIMITSWMTGCAPYKNQFSCPPGSGISCKSVSYVNEQVDNGNLNFSNKQKTNNKKTPVTLKNLPKVVSHQSTNANSLVRVPEKTLRIWLNGFMDGSDCYREEQYVNKVVEKSHWETKTT